MMNFNEYRQASKILVLHYAERLNCEIAKIVASGEGNISSKSEAEELAYFFWEMTAHAVDDEEENRVIEGIEDLQTWLEKALNVFNGYFSKMGYEREWDEGFEKFNRG